MDPNTLGHNIQQVTYHVAMALLWPVVIASLACLIWVIIEFGAFLYESYLRARYRDLEALEISALQARAAFAAGKPRRAYRLLQQNRYSILVTRFLFDLIRNYQGARLAEKPLKLLQEYEFYSVKRLENTRILTRVGPILGIAGCLIPLMPSLVALSNGNTLVLGTRLTLAFSVVTIGLIVGGLAFIISTVRDRYYSQDISDLEYLLELLEGSGERMPALIEHPEATDESSEDGGDEVEGASDENDEVVEEASGEIEEGTGNENPATRVFTTAAVASETTLAMSLDDLQSADADASTPSADGPAAAEEPTDKPA